MGCTIQASKVIYGKHTKADLMEIINSVEITKCKVPTCNNPAFAQKHTKADHTNRDGMCEECFMAYLDKEFSEEREKLRREVCRADSRERAKGAKYVVRAWIHPGNGDDYMMDYYYHEKPVKAQIVEMLKGVSRVSDDFKIEAL